MAFPSAKYRPLPDGYYRAIGRVVAEAALLEEALRQAIWRVVRGSQSFGREEQVLYLTRNIEASELVGILQRFGKEGAPGGQPDDEFVALLGKIKKAQADRNALVHGTWMVNFEPPHLMGWTGSVKRKTSIPTEKHIEETADLFVQLREELEQRTHSLES